MICPTCQGKPQHPPCMECGGSGFSHCCDGPPEQPAAIECTCPDFSGALVPNLECPVHFKGNKVTYKIGDIVPKQFRNCGGSYGLEFLYIFGNVGNSQWIIWHRHTGEVVYIASGKYPNMYEYECRDECQRRNGLKPNTVSQSVLNEIDAQE